MATIEFSDAHFQQLTAQAAAAGYADVSAYLKTLVEDAAFDARCGMSEEQLRESAADCAQIDGRMRDAEGHEAKEALNQIAQRRGLKTPS
ncbi:hypothetical protein Mal64_25490 [Pseudobythopirellula maris]|uniref:Uncharacterized protein n=1 Tax=Pseudobythopirellula maris TaxID=2527991 RepID=A0A5C5ZQ51_9BACT|nr:hypothetical protein [Pseudobythopirellula maris]TWT89057.1 hypothetical protein Mal64_25490 [Pseudobythopirellula maris]